MSHDLRRPSIRYLYAARALHGLGFDGQGVIYTFPSLYQIHRLLADWHPLSFSDVDDGMGEGTWPLRVAIIGIIQMSPVAQKCPSLPGAFFEQLNYEYSKHIGRKYSKIL